MPHFVIRRMDELDLLQQNVTYDGSGNVEYIGYSPPGASPDDEAWMIVKFTTDGSGLRKKRFANNLTDFSLKWRNYASYDYSA